MRENIRRTDHFHLRRQALLGDLLTQVPDRESPLQRAEANIDRFADPTGKQAGRLMMAKDNREMVTANDVVYIDLGGEDNVKARRLPDDLSPARHRQHHPRR